MAAMEDEGKPLVEVDAFHFADEDGVVAGGIFGDKITSEVRERAFEKRNAGVGPMELQAQAGFGFDCLVALGKMFGKRLLVFAKDADSETALRFEEGEEARVLVHTDKNKEWIDGYGSEGVCGHAVDKARLAFDGDDGDTRGESARNAAEQSRINSLGFHSRTILR